TSGKRTGKLSILACCYGGAPNRNFYDEEQFSGALRMPFEDMQIPVPRGYEEVLRSRYGEGFMQIPPHNRRRRKHTVYLDPDRSWRDVDPKDVLEGLREANRLSLMR
ncbi:MAG: LicD family protein, partial [Firmicutes bacterium]|nr:LicD family protein [Bacillota bacterium]